MNYEQMQQQSQVKVAKNSEKVIALNANAAHKLEVELGQNSKLTLVQLVKGAEKITNNISLGKGALLKNFIVHLEGKTIVEHNIALKGEGSEAEFSACFLAGNQDKLSINTVVTHSAPSTTSNVKIYGALKGSSRASSTGNIKIEKNAQKTNAFFASHALLLDKNSRAESIPALEIEANDVKAGHSASTTKLSEEEVFYLNSRGFEQSEAEKTIVLAFLQRAFTPEFSAIELIEQKWNQI